MDRIYMDSASGTERIHIEISGNEVADLLHDMPGGEKGTEVTKALQALLVKADEDFYRARRDNATAEDLHRARRDNAAAEGGTATAWPEDPRLNYLLSRSYYGQLFPDEIQELAQLVHDLEQRAAQTEHPPRAAHETYAKWTVDLLAEHHRRLAVDLVAQELRRQAEETAGAQQADPDPDPAEQPWTSFRLRRGRIQYGAPSGSPAGD